MMKLLVKPINPDLSYLIDITIAEEDPLNGKDWVPVALDWTGTRKEDDVVHRWIMKDEEVLGKIFPPAYMQL